MGKREKPCFFCSSGEINVIHHFHPEDRKIHIRKAGRGLMRLTDEENGREYDIGMRFCPMCGREAAQGA